MCGDDDDDSHNSSRKYESTRGVCVHVWYILYSLHDLNSYSHFFNVCVRPGNKCRYYVPIYAAIPTDTYINRMFAPRLEKNEESRRHYTICDISAAAAAM